MTKTGGEADHGAKIPKCGVLKPTSAGHDDERNGGIDGSDRRHVADLLPLDEPDAEPKDTARGRLRQRFLRQ